ncbi:unnamed protein product, partial [Discosporangium mesarthrocarpum]
DKHSSSGSGSRGNVDKKGDTSITADAMHSTARLIEAQFHRLRAMRIDPTHLGMAPPSSTTTGERAGEEQGPQGLQRQCSGGEAGIPEPMPPPPLLRLRLSLQ